MKHRTLASLSIPLFAVAAAAGCGQKAGNATTIPAPPSEQPAAVTLAPPELKTVEEVLDASLAAQGGRDRMAPIKSKRQIGRISIPQANVSGSFTIVNAPPRSSHTTLELQGVGKMLEGVRDDFAWEANPMTGARIVGDSELASKLRESTFHADLMWKDLFPTRELVGVVEFAGQRAYKVALTPADGDMQTRYFATDTLLPLGRQMTMESQMGKVAAEESYSDYRDVNGMKFPFKIVQSMAGQTMEMQVDSVELDVELPPGTFDIPEEIKALQKPASTKMPAAPTASGKKSTPKKK